MYVCVCTCERACCKCVYGLIRNICGRNGIMEWAYTLLGMLQLSLSHKFHAFIHDFTVDSNSVSMDHRCVVIRTVIGIQKAYLEKKGELLTKCWHSDVLNSFGQIFVCRCFSYGLWWIISINTSSTPNLLVHLQIQL